MNTEEKIKLINGYKKLSTTKLENILNDTLFELKTDTEYYLVTDKLGLSNKRKKLLTVKVIVELELKDRLEELIKIFETHNIKH